MRALVPIIRVAFPLYKGHVTSHYVPSLLSFFNNIVIIGRRGVRNGIIL